METDSNTGKSKRLRAVLFALSALIIVTFVECSAKQDQPITNPDSLASADSIAEARWTQTQLNEQRTHTVTSLELSAAYSRNEVAADNKYKGKMLWITGRIEDIGKDITDKPYVVLSGGVQCFIGDANMVALMNKGEIIKLRGTGGGKLGLIFVMNCAAAPSL